MTGGEASAARALHQILNLGGVGARKEIFQARRADHLARRENLQQRLVDELNRTVGANRQHARGNAFQDRFREAAAAVQFGGARLQLFGHLIEAAHQKPEFVHRLHLHAIFQVALAHLAGAVEDGRDGTLIWRARNSAIQVATNSTNSVMSASSMM